MLEFDNMETCKCCGCQGCDIEEESFFEKLSEDEKEYVEIVADDILDSSMEMINELLAEMYLQAFRDGENSAMLVVSDSLKGIVEKNIY